ncbi:MAG: RpiB/LacA/LacB family sugar-phosphate isomerase [Chloroflexi bacterium]|nr:RpiB/LacA/LacB family sugar-phosphate isomerase [Chloroflexota bacterium]
MKIAIGSDERMHLTDRVIENIRARGHAVELFGPLREEKATWTLVAQAVAEAVARADADEGILFCWTGTGVSIAANKVPGIRAALAHDAETAKGARMWNRANVLCLSLRATSEIVAQEILDAWFATPMGTDPVDVQCVEQVQEIEEKYTGRQANG